MGGHVLRNSYRLVKPGGALVSIVEAPDIEEASRLGIRATFVFVEPNGAQLREITRLIETGDVRPPEITEMNLEEAPRGAGTEPGWPCSRKTRAENRLAEEVVA